ncbi:MAG: hypothetical protein K6F88_03030 [Ruminococcus sp.]|nr:hypothetical protein [Ruminococcus sp.]
MKKIITLLLSVLLAFGTILEVSSLDNISDQALKQMINDVLGYLPDVSDVREEKIICNATLKNNFFDDAVMVVFNHKTSLDNIISDEFEGYTADFFKLENISYVKCLTSYTQKSIKEDYKGYIEDFRSKLYESKLPNYLSETELEELALDAAYKKGFQNNSNYHTIVAAYLKEKGKQKVLDAVKEIEKRDDVISVEPNFIEIVANQLTNPMKITVKTKTVKYKDIKKAKRIVAPITVKKAKGKVIYKKLSGSKKLSLKSNGKIVVKKGSKKGTYTAKIKVTAKGNSTYKSASKTVKVKVKVR